MGNRWLAPLPLALAVLLLAAACQRTGAATGGQEVITQPVSVVRSAFPAGAEGPRLVIEEEALDFGEVPAGRMVQATYHIRNVGTETVRLEEPLVRVVEGCCPFKAQAPASLDPGQVATLTTPPFTMTGNMAGQHLFALVLRSSDPIAAEQTAYLRVNFVAQ